MSERIKITTNVPVGTEVSVARQLAKINAADALGIHIVEETLLPASPERTTLDPVSGEAITAPSPNDHTVDRVLTTWWAINL